ncbi:MAG: hypothetical protein K2H09_01780, partial [Treponemataceae bacterium]|nr:hypothetical protein [Treponemataceae bacterium]
MKKIIAIAAALGAAAVQLPAEKANYFDFVISAPIQSVSESVDSGTLATDVISVAVGISSRRMFSTFAGLYAAVNIAFPQKLDFKIEGDGSSYSRVRGDYSN